ncbi:MAG: ABC transporter permease [Gammaproteobacteria bacterium]|uniref:ABC transporter permease n=1 Tax=Pseudomaricurvus alcaniphilus TaxID=1166482 RepID=UPI001408446C|nr:ABC transporter permease [Pseudomaricurvus alcaniphilus]MBR9912314.1 ABC transporter permease [Gammaproteobacteria bacterium]NHN39326.1 ABC transporter permease [Pseudomaricurvus alcaniphilus]
MSSSQWLAVRKNLPAKPRAMVAFFSFLLPITIWCLVSYVPFLWHPMVEIQDKGGVAYFKSGMLVERELFEQERLTAIENQLQPPSGIRTNPIYLPAPHEVAVALYTSFTTEPKRRSEKWLHESLWESIQVIFWGFVLSSLFGVPLGILAGTYDFFSRLFEPFIEFFRYLPAPAFGALAVAILGIYHQPKIAIIFIGTFFQQVLVIANTTRKLDPSLLEAAQTLGAKNKALLFKVVVPGVLPDLYRDMRILLGWAWTYLIVSELVGTSSGITWFITQQARYKNFDNVFAAIMIIGIIGLSFDILLALIGKKLFPWQKAQ